MPYKNRLAVLGLLMLLVVGVVTVATAKAVTPHQQLDPHRYSPAGATIQKAVAPATAPAKDSILRQAESRSQAVAEIEKSELEDELTVDKRRMRKAGLVVRVKDIELLGGEGGRTHYYAHVASIIQYDLQKLDIVEVNGMRPPHRKEEIKRIYIITTDVEGVRPLAKGSSATWYIDRFKEDIWYVIGDTIRTGVSHVDR